MAVSSQDKALIGAGLLLAVASAATFTWLGYRHARMPSGPPPSVELTNAPYVASAPDAPPVKTETWAPPVAQTRGRDWIYDTFTPPEIFYNTRSHQFNVKPPSSLLDEDQLVDFGLDLIAVHPEPFRLQLMGFSGTGANARGIFQNVPTGEVILATSGRRVPNLGLTIQSFKVAPQTIRIGQSTPSNQLVATAVVRDEKTGRDVILTNRERVFTGTLFAFVAPTDDNTQREVRAGDTFKLGEATYRIDKITGKPASIEVTKTSPALADPDHRVLTPREAEEATERPDGNGS